MEPDASPEPELLPPRCQSTRPLASGTYKETKAVPKNLFCNKVKGSPGLPVVSVTLHIPLN